MILKADNKWAKDRHLEFHPTITINDFTYRGNIEFKDIREAICAGYQKRPEHCNLEEIWTAEGVHDEHGNLVTKVDQRKERESVGIWQVIGTLVLIILVNLGLGIYLQKQQQRDTNDELSTRVNNEVQNYFAVSAVDSVDDDLTTNFEIDD